MKRTINEIYNLIEEKSENAKRDIERINNSNNCNNVMDLHEWNNDERRKLDKLKGQVEAYLDVLYLMLNSGVLDDDR